MDGQALMTYSPTGGYFVADRFAVPPDALADGSENILCLAGHNRVFRGLKDDVVGVGARQMFKLYDGWGGLVDNGATEGNGSIFNYISNSLFWIGQGKVFRNGVAMEDSVSFVDYVASSNLQLSPYPYSHAYTAGLAQPDAPLVEARFPTLAEDGAGYMKGVFSFKIARVRSLTGGRSIASPTSAAVLFSGQSARLTFPALDSNGQDRWAVFATKAGFGGTGVHYLVQEVADTDLSTIDGVDRSYEFNIVDADLLPITSYIDDYPPPAGSFAGRLENYIVVIGCYDNAIAVSLRNFPESFNPDHLAFLPKAPTAVLSDQFGSYVYVSCEDSVHALSVAPTAFGNPLILQTVWSDTGVAHNHNWASVEGVLYAFTSRQGAVTMDQTGKPTNEFAIPVAKKMKDWEVADTIVLHVPDLNGVLFANGGEAYLWNYQIGQWSSPVQLSDFATGDAISGVVIDRRLKLCLLNGTSFDLYDFDEQPTDGETDFTIVSPELKQPQGRLNVHGVRSVFNAPNSGTFTTKAVVDYGDREQSLATVTTAAGMNTSKRSRWYLPRAEAARIEFSGTQTDFDEDCYLSACELYGTVEGSVVIT